MTFGAIGKLLENLDQAGADEHQDNWDNIVIKQLSELEESYKILRVRDRKLINYSELSTQLAYVFMYAIGRAEFTFEIIKRLSSAVDGKLFSDGELRVSSIGGGPGSELAGLIKFLESDACGAKITRITYRVFDKEQNWRHVVEQLCESLDTKIQINLIFVALDVEDTAACYRVSLSEDDLIIMSFFVSEVCEVANRDDVIASLNHLLGTVSTKSHLFYNDSDAYSFYTFINERTNAAKRYDQRVEIQEMITVKAPNFEGVFDDMIERFGKTPHLNSKAVAKLFQRRDQ